jgi:hypothetical protein
MNILDAEDLIKGLPDDALTQEAQAPSGQVPQFLVVSEIQRRTDMRKRYENDQQQNQGTVAEQIVQEGIAGMMPQQPMGMPPQGMPQGMPPQMPQGMPPMGMAQGGIARMENGGSTGMPGAYGLYGLQKEYIDPLLDKAKVLAQTARVSIEEAYEALKREAAMNMPNYGMLVPSGNDIPGVMSDMSDAMGRGIQSAYDRISQSSPDGGMVGRGMDEAGRLVDRGMDAMGRAMPERRSQAEMAEMFSSDEVANRLANRPGLSGLIDRAEGAVDSAGNYISSAFDSAVDSAGDYLGQAGDYISSAAGSAGDYLGQAGDYIADDVRRSVAPLREYDIAATQRISDAYNRSGLGSGIGQFAREIPGAVGTTLGTALTGLANSPPIAGAANMLDQLVTGSTDNPLTIGQMLGGDTQKAGVEPADSPIAETLPLVQERQTDASDPGARAELSVMDDYFGSNPFVKPAGGKEVQSVSKIQQQSLPSELGFADLIADSRRMAGSNALMQLGAGIAGGNLSQGISAAGMAANKGMQDARSLEMKERLAKYQAGREDAARAEKADQFTKTFGLSEKKLAALIEQNASTTQREALRTLVSLFEGELDQTKKAGYSSQIQQILAELRGAPNYGVPTSPQPVGGAARPSLASYER